MLQEMRSEFAEEEPDIGFSRPSSLPELRARVETATADELLNIAYRKLSEAKFAQQEALAQMVMLGHVLLKVMSQLGDTDKFDAWIRKNFPDDHAGHALGEGLAALQRFNHFSNEGPENLPRTKPSRTFAYMAMQMAHEFPSANAWGHAFIIVPDCDCAPPAPGAGWKATQ